MRPPASAVVPHVRPGVRVVALTSIAMLAFASNSAVVPARAAGRADRRGQLRQPAPRIGALMLAIVAHGARRPAPPADWPAAAMLFAYVTCFRLRLTVSAATGALILFGAVQLTMFAAGWHAGERFAATGWAGFGAALGGLVISCRRAAAPTPRGAALMTAAGIAWGVYSIRGRRPVDPVAATAGNFLRAAPLALALSVAPAARLHVTPAGLALAALSGALTSGLGYVVRYAALRHLTAMRAAAVQLSVRPSPRRRAAPVRTANLAARARIGRDSAASRPCSRRGRGGRQHAVMPVRRGTPLIQAVAKPAHGYRARVLMKRQTARGAAWLSGRRTPTNGRLRPARPRAGPIATQRPGRTVARCISLRAGVLRGGDLCLWPGCFPGSSSSRSGCSRPFRAGPARRALARASAAAGSIGRRRRPVRPPGGQCNCLDQRFHDALPPELFCQALRLGVVAHE